MYGKIAGSTSSSKFCCEGGDVHNKTLVAIKTQDESACTQKQQDLSKESKYILSCKQPTGDLMIILYDEEEDKQTQRWDWQSRQK